MQLGGQVSLRYFISFKGKICFLKWRPFSGDFCFFLSEIGIFIVSLVHFMYFSLDSL